ncbi:uncharacterized protein [Montipora foliosa]|uniref:uncharacterized protein n=1 Tax=Montipora foliosa TaxID=591990 RepID=UPI0035F212C3
MGKPKAKQKVISSPKSPTTTSDDEFCENWEKIEAKIEAKLNKWIDERLPSIIQLKIQEFVDPAVNKLITSPKFCESVSESLKFDLEQCRNIESILEELKVSNETLTSQLDDLEQYTRRTNIRIYGIPESNVESADTREDTDILSLNFVKEELGVDLKLEDISRSHRVGKRSSMPRPIIVRLSRHNTKVEILPKRKMLKKNKRPYNVQEDLTQPRRDILKYLNKDIPPNIVDKVWTVDGVICLRPTQHTSTIERFTTMAKCREIVRKYSPS